jgi:hypothetical protein
LTTHDLDLALYVFRQHFFQHPSCWLSVHVFGCLTIWICKLPIVPEQGGRMLPGLSAYVKGCKDSGSKAWSIGGKLLWYVHSALPV